MSRSRKSGIQQPPPEPKRYEIVLTRAAERGLASLPKTELRRVDAKIQGLAEIPRPPGVKKRTWKRGCLFSSPVLSPLATIPGHQPRIGFEFRLNSALVRRKSQSTSD